MQKELPPPGDWVVNEEAGDSVVTLTRKHKGEEVIVEFSVNNQVGQPAAVGPLHAYCQIKIRTSATEEA